MATDQKVGGSSPLTHDQPVLRALILSIGILAQLGEHLPYKQRVIGSSPIGPIFKNADVAHFMAIEE